MNCSNPVRNPKGIIFTDFDGTLFSPERTIHQDNFAALKRARSAGYATAIATGRSLFSFRRVAASIEPPLEDHLDYLIFSSGAGAVKSSRAIRGFDTPLKAEDLIEAGELNAAAAFEAAGLLFRRGIDFMIHKSVPENHRFIHIKSNGAVNPDYYRRIRIYEDFAEPLEPADGDSDIDRIEKACFKGVSQLLAVVPPAENGNEDRYKLELIEYLQHRLPDCSVIRTTSPLDHHTLWIEFFNPDVSKAKTADRISKSLGLTESDALAVGNDFNDEDLLSWAGTARTVDEAPEALRSRFITSGPSGRGAVAAAIDEFIS